MKKIRRRAITKLVAKKVSGKEYPTQLIVTEEIGEFRIISQ